MFGLTRVISASAAAGLAAAGASVYNKKNQNGEATDKSSTSITSTVKPNDGNSAATTEKQPSLYEEACTCLGASLLIVASRPSEFFHLKIGNKVDWRNGGRDR